MTEAYTTIRYERDGGIGHLTLARPDKRNAQNPLMWQELVRLGDELLGDESLRCLVVMGEGPTFSAGIDLVEGIAKIQADMARTPERSERIAVGLRAAGTFSWIPELGCASVAAVRGHAVGAGLQLALACDFRIFAEGTEVGLTETRYGLLPDMGATVRLPRIVGESRARELILLGEMIDAAEALRTDWPIVSCPTKTSTPRPTGWRRAWLRSRRSRCAERGVRSTRPGTAIQRRASSWPSRARSGASSPRTSVKRSGR